MPRKEIEIKTRSFVHVGDKLVNTQDLTPEQKKKLATWIKVTYLNALFAGKAKFWAVGEGESPENATEEPSR
jgi:hypothetical protein